jgi:predicted dehydrogenase
VAVRIGFVGAGGIANVHFNCLAKVPEAKVVAVCDVDGDRAKRAAERFGAQVHLNAQAMLERAELDALYVCVPPFAHGDVELEAARRGLHLFVEKPVHLSVEKAEETAQAIAESNVVSSVGYHWRYFQTTDQARELLGQSHIAFMLGYWMGGMPGVGWWRVRSKSGGQLVEQTTHIVDLARFFAGDVQAVHAVSHQGVLEKAVENFDVDDASTVNLRFVGKTIASITSSCMVRHAPNVSLEMFTDRLAVRLTGQTMAVRREGELREVTPRDDPYLREDQTFIAAIVSGDASAIRSPYRDAVETLRVTLAAGESMRTGRAVAL